MSKILSVLFLLSVFSVSGQAQELRFNASGEFKILQFTDLHINYKHGANDPVFDLIAEIVDAEHPDLVMFTGDIVVKKNPKEIYQRIAKILADRKTYWAEVLGNHDEEFGTTRDENVEILHQMPFCLTAKQANIKGASNFILPVTGRQGKPGAYIFGIDSQSSSKDLSKSDGYDWFGLDQIVWLNNQTAKQTELNGGKIVPSVAFFHIPFIEYNDAWNNPEIKPIGVKNEGVACPMLNAGMFTAMVESGSIMGTFVGHDHTNDYIGVSHNIALVYGRCGGGVNAYGDLPDGGRVIVLKEGKRSFDTWIHEKGGNIVLKCNFPESFPLIPKKKK
ncbi:MAG: metallophosphoesterase family protein [Marinilabiliales bacterium]|nr:metallophosphoesterase family protein [Marinilabiliales bacterium]